MEKRFVYADNAATTAISQEVLSVMMPWLTEGYGNPSSIYSKGREAARVVEDAREKTAKALGARTDEIYFTGCGTESDNWALKGTMQRLGAKGKKHLITTVFEHHAILHTAQALEKQGYEVTYLPVSSDGLVTARQVAEAIRPDTALVSVMYANNEIGTVQPIAEIGAVCRERGVLFHTDAVQAVGNIAIDVKEQNIDMLSLSGHKIHGPKGVGALYIRKGTMPVNLLDGGEQERGRRAGTENVASIVGLGVAMERAAAGVREKTQRLIPLRDSIIEGLLKLPMARLNGHREQRLPGTVNFSFVGAEGEALLLGLDLRGICASSGSACTTGSLDPSHVLLALGLSHEVAHGSVRISLSEDATAEDAEYLVKNIAEVVEKTRNISPLWEDICKGRKEVQ